MLRSTRIMKLRCATRAHVIHIYMQLSLLHWPYDFLAIQYICYMSSHENEFHLCGTLRSTQIKKLWYAKRAHPIYICIYWTLSTAVIHIRFSQSYAFTVWVHDQIQLPWKPNLKLREFEYCRFFSKSLLFHTMRIFTCTKRPNLSILLDLTKREFLLLRNFEILNLYDTLCSSQILEAQCATRAPDLYIYKYKWNPLS